MGKTNMIDDGYNLVEDLEKHIKELEVENAMYAKMLENRDEFKARLPYNYAEVSETMLDFDDGRKSMKTYWFRWYDSNKHNWDTTEFCAYDISEAKKLFEDFKAENNLDVDFDDDVRCYIVYNNEDAANYEDYMDISKYNQYEIDAELAKEHNYEINYKKSITEWMISTIMEACLNSGLDMGEETIRQFNDIIERDEYTGMEQLFILDYIRDNVLPRGYFKEGY